MNINIVLYTDGGAIDNPGKIGYAFHGYSYEESSNKPVKAEGWTLTDKGYVKNISQDDVWVLPIKYIDYVGSSANIATNNIAEMLAMLNAFKYIKNNKPKQAIIYTDSKYVYSGLNEWLRIWIPNDFIKSNGEKVLNADLWKELSILKSDIESSEIELTINWIKAHNGNIGNERVDQLATIGNNLAIDNEVIDKLKEFDVKSYWSAVYTRNPLLNFKRIYFNSLSSFNKPGTYYQANPSDKDMYIGKRLPGDGYSIVKLKEPDYIVESVIERQVEVCNGYNGIYLCKLENLFKKNNLKYMEEYGKYTLRPINKNNDLESVTKSSITMELNPTGLSLRAIDNFNYLEDILESYIKIKDGDDTDFSKLIKLSFIDITDVIFEVKTIKNKEIKCIKSSITPATKHINIEIKRGSLKLSLPITFNIDIPSINNLKKLNTDELKIIMLTWYPCKYSIGYAIVIEHEKDIGIWTDFFSNRIYLL